jgi:hypothetical protein
MWNFGLLAYVTEYTNSYEGRGNWKISTERGTQPLSG